MLRCCILVIYPIGEVKFKGSSGGSLLPTLPRVLIFMVSLVVSNKSHNVGSCIHDY